LFFLKVVVVVVVVVGVGVFGVFVGGVVDVDGVIAPFYSQLDTPE
jgi:hypothetical protein